MGDIKMDFTGIGYETLAWNQLVQCIIQWCVLVNTVMKLLGQLSDYQLLKRGSVPWS